MQMGQTALHVASLWGNQDAIRVLIQLGANPNAQNMRSVRAPTATASSATGRQASNLPHNCAPAFLLACFLVCRRGSTPLHFAAAAKKDALAVCQLLISSGANPGQPDLHGYLPYEQAETPEVRVLLGGPDQRLFDYAGECAVCGVVVCRQVHLLGLTCVAKYVCVVSTQGGALVAALPDSSSPLKAAVADTPCVWRLQRWYPPACTAAAGGLVVVVGAAQRRGVWLSCSSWCHQVWCAPSRWLTVKGIM